MFYYAVLTICILSGSASVVGDLEARLVPLRHAHAHMLAPQLPLEHYHHVNPILAARQPTAPDQTDINATLHALSVTYSRMIAHCLTLHGRLWRLLGWYGVN